MKLIFWVAIFGSAVNAYTGGEEDKCTYPTNKKVLKLFEKAHDSKLAKKDQYQALKDALAIDENCIQCMLELGIRSFQNNEDREAAGQKVDFSYAIQYFTDILSHCPQYHADPYYYLGVIHYKQKNNADALKYFNLFLNYKGTGENNYADDHTTKIRDVKEILPELEFSENFYKNVVPFNPEVVAGVSTEKDEYLPMLSPDNEMIFYTRRFERAMVGENPQRVEEFTTSLRDDISQPFDIGSALPPPFNTGPNFGGATISIDNKEIIFCACKDEKRGVATRRNCDLYSVHYNKYKDPDSGKEQYKWGEMMNLGPNINAWDEWEAQPSLSADGKTLFYAKQGAGTKNTSIDIYYSTRKPDGSWAPGKSVGDVINTDYDDKTPFLHTDSHTLYFTSDTEPGMRLGAGGFDIFYSKQDEKGIWSKPKNIGYPINTSEDEHGLVVSTDGKMAYFSSGKYKGKGGLDIFRFELYPDARPEKVVIISGSLKDVDGNVVSDAKVEIKYADDKKVEEAHVDRDEGKFYAVVKTKKPQDVVVTVKKEGHAFDTKLIEKTDLEKEKPVKNVSLAVMPIEKGKSYTLNDILFATGSYDLSPKAKFVIDQFVDFLKETPKVKVEIQGHTDDVGDPVANLTLSENRARAVMDYITSKGISTERLTSKGYGQAKPKVPNTSVENQAKNRRTEFFIVEL
ncbi:MAG TPA: OmpA family protein [Flavobacteriales bacterium]|nr:OmpA family protein [Flavobacteriales bacterium]